MAGMRVKGWAGREIGANASRRVMGRRGRAFWGGICGYMGGLADWSRAPLVLHPHGRVRGIYTISCGNARGRYDYWRCIWRRGTSEAAYSSLPRASPVAPVGVTIV